MATGDGVCRFNPIGAAPNQQASTLDGSQENVNGAAAAEPMFVVYNLGDDKAAQHVNALMEDHAGVVWCGTNNGIFRLEQGGGHAVFRSVDIGLPTRVGDGTYVDSMLEGRRGALWVGTGDGLYRRLPDGRAERYTIQHGLPSNFVESMLEDGEGRLWVGTRYGGLCRIADEPDLNRSIVARVHATRDGLPSNWITSLFQSSDNRLWAATIDGVSEFIPSGEGGLPAPHHPSRSRPRAAPLPD